MVLSRRNHKKMNQEKLSPGRKCPSAPSLSSKELYHRCGCYQGSLSSGSGLEHLPAMPGYHPVPNKRKNDLRKGYWHWRWPKDPRLEEEQGTMARSPWEFYQARLERPGCQGFGVRATSVKCVSDPLGSATLLKPYLVSQRTVTFCGYNRGTLRY